MKHLRTYEKFGAIDPPMDIGYDLFKGGAKGVLIGPDHFKDLSFTINFLKEKNIKFRLFFDKNFLILVSKEDIEKLPSDIGGRGLMNYIDYYIPFSEGEGYGLGWFYQDIFDEGNWKEVWIETPEDMEELDLLINAKNYNL